VIVHVLIIIIQFAVPVECSTCDYAIVTVQRAMFSINLLF